MGALALSIGIAIQNFPEGAIISGRSARRAWQRTGVPFTERSPARWNPRAQSSRFSPRRYRSTMPILLSFMAGAMMYVVVEELIPEMAEGDSNTGRSCSRSVLP